MKIKSFTFNPFQENTYLVYDETGECIIFDPGNSNEQEHAELVSKIESLNLRPVRLINTHCHLDHVFGNAVLDRAKRVLHFHLGEDADMRVRRQVGHIDHRRVSDQIPCLNF